MCRDALLTDVSANCSLQLGFIHYEHSRHTHSRHTHTHTHIHTHTHTLTYILVYLQHSFSTAISLMGKTCCDAANTTEG